MRADEPSRTAWYAAVHRAVHQRVEGGSVFRDPFAVRVVGLTDEELDRNGAERGRRGMRFLVVARARLADEQLRAALARGVDQVIVLGAGLDTTALRLAAAIEDARGAGGATAPPDRLTVFEVDHPASQRWRADVLGRAGLEPPRLAVPVAVDFESQQWPGELARAGFDARRPAVVLWLGVLAYLTRDAVAAALAGVGGLAAGSLVVLDYAIPPEERSEEDRAAHARRRARLEAIEEPWQTFLTPGDVAAMATGAGLRVAEDAAVSDFLAHVAGRPAPVRGSAARLAVLAR